MPHHAMELLLPCVLLFISLLSHVCCTQSDQPYTAIFSFGDSYADTGNFISITKDLLPYDKYEHSPYGMTFFGHPTGRSSDGRLVIDFIALDLGLPLVPPYFSQSQDFSTGANFAFIGATALSIEFLRQQGITTTVPVDSSLDFQLGWFQKLKPFLCNTTESCHDYLSKSLFVLGEVGGNDYNFLMSSGKSIHEILSYVPVIMDTIRKAAETLLKQGVLHIVLPGVTPRGCIPIVLTNYASENKSDYDYLGCLKKYNTIGIYHNLKLKELLVQLQNSYPQARIIYADYHGAVDRLPAKSRRFADENQLVIFCGGGPYNYNATALCGQPGVLACSNPSKHINRDGVHLTETAYRTIAAGWLKGSYAHPPIYPVTSIKIGTSVNDS